MTAERPTASRQPPTGAQSYTGEEQEDEPTQPIRWLRRLLPLVILLLVAVLAARELRSIDIHAVRAVLGALSPAKLLTIQLLALAGVLSMGLYDWHAARIFEIGMAPRTLIRNAWIANAFNNLIGLSGLAGSGIRMVLMTADRIETKRAAAFSALIMASVPIGLAVLCWPILLSGGPGLDKLPIPAWAAWLAMGAFASYLVDPEIFKSHLTMS